MGFRKLIKFGNTSHVISLPSDWIKKNKLKKGDLVFFEENGKSELILNPNETNNKIEDKEITFDVTGKENDEIYREISAAYVNNYRTINFIGKDLQQKSQFIKKILQNLMAMEIMEQTSKNIIAKDFLDITTISIEDVFRKIDIIVRSLISDSMLTVKENNFDDIYQRDDEVNRLSLLLCRIIKVAFSNPYFLKNIKLNPHELLGYWELIHRLERIADETKRISRFLTKVRFKGKRASDFTELYSKIEAYYLDTIKAYYSKNSNSAIKLAIKKKYYMELCDDYSKVYGDKKWVQILIERMKIMIKWIHDICEIIYEAKR